MEFFFSFQSTLLSGKFLPHRFCWDQQLTVLKQFLPKILPCPAVLQSHNNIVTPSKMAKIWRLFPITKPAIGHEAVYEFPNVKRNLHIMCCFVRLPWQAQHSSHQIDSPFLKHYISKVGETLQFEAIRIRGHSFRNLP